MSSQRVGSGDETDLFHPNNMADQRGEVKLNLFRSVQRHPHGKFPAVAINDGRVVIELHQPFFASTTIYYQLGRSDADQVRNWTEPEFLDYGRFPKVAINNDNRVVEVHEGAYTRRVYYRIGRIEVPRNGIPVNCNWEGDSSELLDWGRYPAVAIHGNRVMVTYDSSYFRNNTYYRIGTINANGMRIDWGRSNVLFNDASAAETSVAMNAEYVVAVGRGWSNFVCLIAQMRNVDPEGAPDYRLHARRRINCNHVGVSPNICLTADRHIILVWQSRPLRHLQYSIAVAENPQERAITFDRRKKDFNNDYGYNPSMSISPNGRYVLEEHESNISKIRSTLHYHTGSLDRGAENEQPQQVEENRF